jgi:hypothetical protein
MTISPGLQAEPWEPGELVHLTEKALTCWPGSFSAAFDEVRSAGIKTVFLWGVEYWLFRIKHYNDPTWFNAANYLMETSK